MTLVIAAILGIVATSHAISVIRHPSGLTIVVLWVIISIVALIVCVSIQALLEGIVEVFKK